MNYRLKNLVKFLPYLAENLWVPYFTLNSSNFDMIFEPSEALNNDPIALNNASNGMRGLSSHVSMSFHLKYGPKN